VSLTSIAAGLLLLGISSTAASQDRSIEEWEKKTFEKQPPEKVMDAAGIETGMTIGEVGAGRGRFTLYLARRVGPTGRILANDIDAKSLAYLRSRCKANGIDNVVTILGKIDDPLFPKDSIDMVFMVWTYHFLDKPVPLLKSLMPALKSGGTVILVEPDPVRGPGGSDHGVSPERMRKEASEAGFELVRTETFLPEDLLFVLRVKSP
jgi:SAM-dependent methyltransferase